MLSLKTPFCSLIPNIVDLVPYVFVQYSQKQLRYSYEILTVTGGQYHDSELVKNDFYQSALSTFLHSWDDNAFLRPPTFYNQAVLKSSIWAASSEFGTYRLCEQRRFRRACASAQSRQNLCCWLIQAVSQAEPSDRKPDPWPL